MSFPGPCVPDADSRPRFTRRQAFGGALAIVAAPALQATATTPMRLGVQYYRPPFPESHRWVDDFRQIADAGLGFVQLWVVWAWVEPQPGKWRFDDYDRLFELATANRLGVVLSTVAEVQPLWLPRVERGCELVDHTGRAVVSSTRSETHHGLTPGGCFDHPGVWRRMQGFLEAVARRYRSQPVLEAWDVWNETRWEVQADGFVCHCPHTLTAFRRWLQGRHGDLEGLNRAWKRRYGLWEQVVPGKLPKRSFTETAAFAHFITERCSQHGARRAAVIKRLDPGRPTSLHGPSPSVLHGGSTEAFSTPLHRGNDWVHARGVDALGTSSFPAWGGIDDVGFSVILSHLKSAAGAKLAWLSELQGGRAASGTDAHAPVAADRQQRWLWAAVAKGITRTTFWCWRDEVFGSESGGFGLTGADGHADARLAALRQTLAALRLPLWSRYRPSTPRVGVLFSPRAYYLRWAQAGAGTTVRAAVDGYMRALVSTGHAVTTVEEEHLEALDDLTVLFAPRAMVTTPRLESALATFVERGGTLVAESEHGAFSPEGFYRYPDERWLARRFGVVEIGRRESPPTLSVDLGTGALDLPAKQWLTPMRFAQGRSLSRHADGAAAVEVPAGMGRVLAVGGYLGDAHRERPSAVFERFVAEVSRRAGAAPDVTLSGAGVVLTGRAGEDIVAVALTQPGQQNLRVRFPGKRIKVHDLLADRALTAVAGRGGFEVALPASPWGVAVLSAQPGGQT